MKQTKLLIALSLSFIFANVNADSLPIASVSKQTSQASFEKKTFDLKNNEYFSREKERILIDIGKKIQEKSKEGYFILEYSVIPLGMKDNDEITKNLLLNTLVSELVKSGYKAQVVNPIYTNHGAVIDRIKIDWN